MLLPEEEVLTVETFPSLLYVIFITELLPEADCVTVTNLHEAFLSLSFLHELNVPHKISNAQNTAIVPCAFIKESLMIIKKQEQKYILKKDQAIPPCGSFIYQKQVTPFYDKPYHPSTTASPLLHK